MFKRTATDLDTQPTRMQQRLTCTLKNVRSLPDSCCCLSKNGNEILFRVNISPQLTTIAGLNGTGQWLSLLGNRNSNQ